MAKARRKGIVAGRKSAAGNSKVVVSKPTTSGGKHDSSNTVPCGKDSMTGAGTSGMCTGGAQKRSAKPLGKGGGLMTKFTHAYRPGGGVKGKGDKK